MTDQQRRPGNSRLVYDKAPRSIKEQRTFTPRWFCRLRLHWLADPGVFEHDGDWCCKSCGAVVDRAVPARARNDQTTEALRSAFRALRYVEDWQWGKREPDLRDDQLLSAETVRPMVASAIAQIKTALDAERKLRSKQAASQQE